MFGKRIGIWIPWAQTQKEQVTDESVEPEFCEDAAVVQEFAFVLTSELTMLDVSHPFHTVEAVNDGRGLEALRRLTNRYEPLTALTVRAHVKTIVTTTPKQQG